MGKGKCVLIDSWLHMCLEIECTFVIAHIYIFFPLLLDVQENIEDAKWPPKILANPSIVFLVRKLAQIMRRFDVKFNSQL